MGKIRRAGVVILGAGALATAGYYDTQIQVPHDAGEAAVSTANGSTDVKLFVETDSEWRSTFSPYASSPKGTSVSKLAFHSAETGEKPLNMFQWPGNASYESLGGANKFFLAGCLDYTVGTGDNAVEHSDPFVSPVLSLTQGADGRLDVAVTNDPVAEAVIRKAVSGLCGAATAQAIFSQRDAGMGTSAF